ncbi:hypothetical protein BKA70DRAFT_1308061 [Coprinopsis sp. MPI-PUGE-AT-0042]|nr:hypothetical protein BKA70DRAFT_1308061 [Coprinopsis sp. MPI-PUGE-AT-0042]
MAFPFSSLPPELQAHIFELAADGDHINAPNLSLVSRSAATWVHPRMFHTVSIQNQYSLRSLQLKSCEFLRLYVKRMCITYGAMTMEEASQILSTCTDIVDLAFWLAWPSESTTGIAFDIKRKASIARSLSQLPLQRVEITYEHLLGIERQSVLLGSLPGWCTTLTHLEVLFWRLSSATNHIVVPLLQHLHALTHLCITWPPFIPELHEQVDIASILIQKPSLKFILVDTEQVSDSYIPIDIRIVYLATAGNDPDEEWADRGARVSKWTLAEQEVARRRRDERGEDSALVSAMQNM